MNFRYPYRAVICGEEHIVRGWRDKTLFTDLGKFSVEHIYGDWQFQNWRIFEIATVRSDGNGDWLVNGRPLSVLDKISMGVRLLDIPKNEDLRVYKNRVCAAGWIDTGKAPNVTELLDEIAAFWKTAATPLVKSEYDEPHWSQLLGVLSRGFLDISKYKELFPTWSKPVWLTKFQPIGQIAKPVEVEIVSSQPKYIPVISGNKIPATQTPKMIADTKAVVMPEKSAPEIFFSIEAAANYIGVSKRTILNWKKREWLKVEQNGKKIRIARIDLEKCKQRQ